MSSKKLLEQCQKLEKLWGHVLTGKYFYSTSSNIFIIGKIMARPDA